MTGASSVWYAKSMGRAGLVFACVALCACGTNTRSLGGAAAGEVPAASPDGSATGNGGSTGQGGTAGAAGESGTTEIAGSTGGASGSPCPPPSVGTTPLTDFTTDLALVRWGGHTMSFLVSGDGTGTIWPPPFAGDSGAPTMPSERIPGCSARALHVRGKDIQGFANASAQLGFGMVPVDLSAYTRIVLIATGEGTGILLSVGTADTQPAIYGGRCEPDGGKVCYDGYAGAVTLEPTWKRIELAFDSLRQAGWGVPAPRSLNTREVLTISFGLPLTTSFDLWVAAIGFE